MPIIKWFYQIYSNLKTMTQRFYSVKDVIKISQKNWTYVIYFVDMCTYIIQNVSNNIQT